jgi:riboflavin transporter FmnP
VSHLKLAIHKCIMHLLNVVCVRPLMKCLMSFKVHTDTVTSRVKKREPDTTMMYVYVCFCMCMYACMYLCIHIYFEIQKGNHLFF